MSINLIQFLNQHKSSEFYTLSAKIKFPKPLRSYVMYARKIIHWRKREYTPDLTGMNFHSPPCPFFLSFSTKIFHAYSGTWTWSAPETQSVPTQRSGTRAILLIFQECNYHLKFCCNQIDSLSRTRVFGFVFRMCVCVRACTCAHVLFPFKAVYYFYNLFSPPDIDEGEGNGKRISSKGE